MDGITALVSYMCATGHKLQLRACRSSVSTDAAIRSQVCDFIIQYIEVFGSSSSSVAGLIIMFLSIHCTELKGFTLDFCIRPQHISLLADHNHHMSCTVLQTTAQPFT